MPDWGAIETIFGTAEGVPDLIAELSNGDARLRCQAYVQLSGLVAEQGTLFPAAPFVAEEVLHRLMGGRINDIALGLRVDLLSTFRIREGEVRDALERARDRASDPAGRAENAQALADLTEWNED